MFSNLFGGESSQKLFALGLKAYLKWLIPASAGRSKTKTEAVRLI